MKVYIFLLLIIQILQGCGSICYALFLRDIVNDAVSGNRHKFFYSVLMLIMLICFQLILRAIQRFLEEYTRSGLENRFKRRMFKKIICMDYAYATSVHSGEWMNRLTNDTVVVANGMTDIYPGVAGMAVKITGAIVMVIILESRLLHLIIPGGIILLAFSTTFRHIMKKLHKQIQEQDGYLRVFLQEILGSLLVVRSYAVECDILSTANTKMDAHRKARMRRNHFSNLCNIGFSVVMNGVYLLSAIFCGYGILNGTMSYGTFTAVLELIRQIQAPFANISSYLPRFYAMLASAERLAEVEAMNDSAIVNSRSLREICSLYMDKIKAIGLSHVSFSYLPLDRTVKNKLPKTELRLVLSGINFEIFKGEYVALTGTSGCGKSTVLKLLMCLYPIDSGERYLLMEDGQEILDSSWQKLFAYVPQHNFLMSGTIREIVAFADKGKMWDEERMHKYLSIACADGFVAELDKGVDTLLGEHGLGLSEGQMQRLSIARALFSEHPILLLDECTSALDEQTEKKLLFNLHNMTNKTVIIVTHRPAVLDICDKIFDFSDNRFSVYARK